MIQSFADWLVYCVIGLDGKTALGDAVNFQNPLVYNIEEPSLWFALVCGISWFGARGWWFALPG